MNQETKQCQNCKKEFIIEPEDFGFYEKIKMPPPTFCPRCRLIRRLSWLNTASLYKRKLTGSDDSVISMYSPDKDLTIINDREWWSDSWDPLSYGQEYNFDKPFFLQFADLLKKVPLPHLQRQASSMINSEYCNGAADMKNCYLIFFADSVENCMYGHTVQRSKECMDFIFSYDSELCYEGINLQTCYKTFYSQDCENCRNVWFSLDCFDCSDCFGCVNLRKKSYCIFNEQYIKEEYFKKLEELNLDSIKSIEALKEKTQEFFLKSPRRFTHARMNANASGEYIYQSKNVKDCYETQKAENCRYSQFLNYMTTGASDAYDYSAFGITADLMYEDVWCGLQVSNLKFCLWNYGNQNSYYSIACHNSNNLFGCIGLRKKEYCIFNKQYTKEEYEELVPKIIEHMSAMPYVNSKGHVYKYGEYFPSELSPFGYNETWAFDYFPVAKEDAVLQGYKWLDPAEKSFSPTVLNEKIPDTIAQCDESILTEIFECKHKGSCGEKCSGVFRVITEELRLHKSLQLPLPVLCPMCRHHQRLKMKSPIALWYRTCNCAGIKSENSICQNSVTHFHGTDKCPNEFETSYAPGRPEIVYCEQCYQAEVA